MVNTILKEADLFCPNSVRINFTIYPKCIAFAKFVVIDTSSLV
ncbi:ABC transporter ATP-binding protein [Lactobacillus plantarum]|nr:ABC transporter ATP-binding protein [Lactiplantibacillus plantarum]